MLPEKLTGPQLFNQFPIFCVNWRLIIKFTRAHHLPLSWAKWIQSVPPSKCHFLKINFNIILHLSLGLPSGLFPLGFPTKILYATLLFPIDGTGHANLIHLHFINCSLVPLKPQNAEVKNIWSYTSTLPYNLVANTETTFIVSWTVGLLQMIHLFWSHCSMHLLAVILVTLQNLQDE